MKQQKMSAMSGDKEGASFASPRRGRTKSQKVVGGLSSGKYARRILDDAARGARVRQKLQATSAKLASSRTKVQNDDRVKKQKINTMRKIMFIAAFWFKIAYRQTRHAGDSAAFRLMQCREIKY